MVEIFKICFFCNSDQIEVKVRPDWYYARFEIFRVFFQIFFLVSSHVSGAGLVLTIVCAGSGIFRNLRPSRMFHLAGYPGMLLRIRQIDSYRMVLGDRA